MRRSLLILALVLGGCYETNLLIEAPDSGPDALPSCWDYDCPGDPGANECGTCVHPGWDTECTPGYVCSCFAVCVKGPRSYDGGVCVPDAGPSMGFPDAAIFDWPLCDDRHKDAR